MLFLLTKIRCHLVKLPKLMYWSVSLPTTPQWLQSSALGNMQCSFAGVKNVAESMCWCCCRHWFYESSMWAKPSKAYSQLKHVADGRCKWMWRHGWENNSRMYPNMHLYAYERSYFQSYWNHRSICFSYAVIWYENALALSLTRPWTAKLINTK